MASAKTLMEKIETLPPDRLGEIEDFIDFIAAKLQRQAALDRLLAIAPLIEAAGAETFNDDDCLAEVDAVRAGRHPT